MLYPEPVDETDTSLDFTKLNRELDKTKSSVFLGSNAAFMGSILTSMDFIWTRDIETAATNGITLYWNPDWFLSLVPETRKTVLLHELHHPARLHGVRQGLRQGREWNWACDIIINNDLEDDGYKFDGTQPWKDKQFAGMAEEDIYDILVQKQIPPPAGSWGEPDTTDGDMIPLAQDEKAKAVNAVVKAIHQAKMSGEAGSIPGGLEEVVRAFLEPIVQWDVVLQDFFNDLLRKRYTWAIPDRRFQDIYMPSRYIDRGRLEHLIYYFDTSGSMGPKELLRLNSEVKYVWDKFRPKKMTIVMFDTVIQEEIVVTDGSVFDGITVKGRGGTSLVPVRQHIIDNKPTAAVIFSDLYCPVMAPLPEEIPIIWIVFDNKKAQVPHGTKVHIKA